MRYLILVTQTETGYSAYPPDLPGVGVAGETYEETVELAREAIELHIEDLASQGLAVPEPSSEPQYVDVPGARGAA